MLIFVCHYFSVAEFSMTYDIMKDERNVLKDCVQTASQQCTERREKTEILKNELEVLEVSCNDTRRYELNHKALLYDMVCQMKRAAKNVNQI